MICVHLLVECVVGFIFRKINRLALLTSLFSLINTNRLVALLLGKKCSNIAEIFIVQHT
ncbi:hypothetical protein D5E82_03320 [Vibrio parahaemolyticus]|uniref:Uncharacterized protein n=1 Tax=Vibrio parahaemolyticus TaxID=670 RepID=A0A7Z2RRE0_VIBPH|nr:hypothetical protein [Vibrio parahaemolyticus]EGQ9808775.1 hypothetical protein [Vibrio parahaemolyticus]EGR0291678.1 hypothetical protein [Vibrio parahaemolyticus]EGR1768130.1 hypothetical protein [Vibrio parahaemolyticus]EGR2774053.1 hypothetical protein [Vibrio parahaemolyticus]